MGKKKSRGWLKYRQECYLGICLDIRIIVKDVNGKLHASSFTANAQEMWQPTLTQAALQRCSHGFILLMCQPSSYGFTMMMGQLSSQGGWRL
ncbi:hypothetical protein CEXT_479661 [Caerostris extrusa]|uniref:Uncharacterized protein n=1 Tax=Caerostris extrusa TaxID=172846 RepID=A0AAV4NY64_CAEEX|nr:hypothetical protein CEXT_479661 [Caerostris extrusa]